MSNEHDYQNMDKWELINSLSIIKPTSVQIRKTTSAIAKIYEELSDSNTKLANRVYWLNLIIAIATVAGVLVALLD